MTTTNKPPQHRCGSCALFHPHLCDGSDHEDCDAFQPSDLCRIADALEKLTAIDELLDDTPSTDLSRLELELRALNTCANVQRIEGRADEADRYAREAKVVRRCIAVMRGEVEPLEVEL